MATFVPVSAVVFSLKEVENLLRAVLLSKISQKGLSKIQSAQPAPPHSPPSPSPLRP